MLLPYNVDVPMERRPIVNWFLIAATCIISVAVWAEPAELAFSLVLWRDDDFRPWQPFTCVFVHADWLHLFGNMLFLFVFGNAVNARFGHGWFFALYTVTGVLSSLAWLALGDGGLLLGASGA